MTFSKHWWLGFLGFIGFYKLPEVISYFTEGGSAWMLVGLLWFLWFLEFLPKTKSQASVANEEDHA